MPKLKSVRLRLSPSLSSRLGRRAWCTLLSLSGRAYSQQRSLPGPRWTSIIVFAVLTVGACVTPRQSATQLNLNHPQRRALSTGGRHHFFINLSAGQYARLRVDQHGVDVALTISGPGGKPAAEYESHADSAATISLLAERDGAHRIEVRAAEIETVTGDYELTAEEVRAAAESDKQAVAAERAFAEAERLRVRSEAAASREAVKKYEEAEAHWRAASDKQGEARALKSAGEIYHRLGEPRRALANFEQAQKLSQAARLAELESETLCGLSIVHLHLGNYRRARECANQALAASREAGDRRGEAQALLCQSEVYYGFGNRWESLEYARQSAALCQGTRDRRGLAQALLAQGYIQTDLGEARQAAEYIDQASAIFRALEDRRGQALSRAADAILKAISGDSQAALTILQEAQPVIQAAGDRYWEASFLQNLGAVYWKLKDKDKVLSNFEQALQIWREIENPAEAAGALSAIGEFYLEAKDYDQALSHLQRAYSAAKAVSDKYQSNALRKIGAVYNALGNKKLAISHYRRALDLHRAAGERQGEAYALREIGKLYGSLRQFGTARERFRQALAIDSFRKDRFAEAETLYQWARMEADGGDLATARAHAQVALEIVESLRANVSRQNLRVIYFAYAQRYFEFFITVLMRQHRQQPGAGFAAQALAASERARARSLLELLAESRANIRQGAAPELLKQARELQEQASRLAERKLYLLKAGAPADQVTAVAVELDAWADKLAVVEDRIKVTSPRYASLMQPQPINLDEMRQLLDDDNTLLLEYSLGQERSYLWAVTRGSLTSHALPGREEIEKAAQAVYDLLIPPEDATPLPGQRREAEYWRQAAQLSDKILKPVAAQLGGKRLLIVADGALHYIPFAALPPPSGAPGKTKDRSGVPRPEPLIAGHEVINLPSASALSVLRREAEGRPRATKTIAVLADPVFEPDDIRVINEIGKSAEAPKDDLAFKFPAPAGVRGGRLTRGGFGRLQATQDEARAIEQFTTPTERLIAEGFDANIELAASQELGKYRIIHFATHGLLYHEAPDLSGVVLSLFDRKGKYQKGYLRLHDIYNLNLSAELVVLSACDTGLGQEFKGEGLVGLARGFMYAGAPRVLASLWKVEDEPTAKLMTHFYRHLLKDKLSPAAALRQAQLTLWRDERLHAPYYWGAFLLQGEWK